MNESRAKIEKRFFTLVEIMVVIGIMMLLLALAVPFVAKSFGKGQVAAAKLQIQNFDTAITTFRIDTGKLPQSLDELIHSTGDKKWDGPYLNKKEIPKDPWGNEFIYEKTSDNPNGYTIISYGSDGSPGGEKQAADLSN
ncbi:MAG: type II secretion system major pseudopilin GspG [Kiritimatiellaeota bacterium]|nr:type II secretion system major pseudopilin GspG [Kiritimatiellota bacterium]